MTSKKLAGFHSAVIKFHLLQIKPFFQLLLITLKRLIFKKTQNSALLIEKKSAAALSPSSFCSRTTSSGLSLLSLALKKNSYRCPSKFRFLGGGISSMVGFNKALITSQIRRVKYFPWKSSIIRTLAWVLCNKTGG